MKKILVIGATSAIAQATLRLWAQSPVRAILVGRSSSRLEEVAADLGARGSEVSTVTVDLDSEQAGEIILQSVLTCQGLDICLYAAGTLQDQNLCLAEAACAVNEMQANYLAPVRILIPLLPLFRAQGYGQIAVISSVAGDRGRASNIVYGSAKAGLSAFVDGLRPRMAEHGVDVFLIKPGPCQTPMTAAHNIKGPLMVPPEKVASDIVSGMARGKSTIYSPRLWRWIMLVIKNIPQFIFDRLKL